MRIAILTQPLRANYGGILQAYALQYTLKKLGHNSTIIEQEYIQPIKYFKLLFDIPKRLYTKYILKKREYIFSEHINNKHQIERRKYTSSFITKYIQNCFTKGYNSIDINQYDAFIVGSDQVWRPLYNWGNIDKMFLSFIPKESDLKRISYAASFGTSEWEFTPEQTAVCTKLLSRFDAVSVREQEGIDLCREFLKRNDAVCVLDPTLLHDKAVYENLCKEVPAIDKNTLCAYILDLSDDIRQRLENIATEKGLNLKIVSADNNCTLTVPEWIAMFRDAECIVTDSFHGTAFSIIFNKEFYSIANIGRGRSRFISLLSQFDLTSRLYNSIDEIRLNNDVINWDSVNEKRNTLIQDSINFITSNLFINAQNISHCSCI